MLICVQSQFQQQTKSLLSRLKDQSRLLFLLPAALLLGQRPLATQKPFADSLRHRLVHRTGFLYAHPHPLKRIEDPSENRLEDVPLAALGLTIETNLKEQWGDKDFPQLKVNPRGVVL